MPVAVAANTEADFGLGVEMADDAIKASRLLISVVGAAPESGHIAMGVEIAEEGVGWSVRGGDGNGRCLLRWLDELNGTAVVMQMIENFVETAVGVADKAGVGKDIA